MEPLLLKFEAAKMQEDCLKAWTKAKETDRGTLEWQKLIHQAFPFTVHGDQDCTGNGLRINWWEKYDAFAIFDYGGFITFIPGWTVNPFDGITLSRAIKMESKQIGAFREKITGKKPETLTRPQVPKIPPKKKGSDLTLKDLKL